jgi:hypothetical protein
MQMQVIERLWYVTVLSNFARGYDKYARVYSKQGIPESRFPDQFFLLREAELSIGIAKAASLLAKLDLPGNRLVALRTSVLTEHLQPNARTGLGRWVASPMISVDMVAFINSDRLSPVSVEDLYACSLSVLHPQLAAYSKLAPRSVSVLPVAKGCQAACPFCFSEASVSIEQTQANLDLVHVRRVAGMAYARGANRFVITGGGEPGLLPSQRLLQLIHVGHDTIGKTVLITNGHHLAALDETALTQTLNDYAENGLNVLAISRHHFDEAANSLIMGIKTTLEDIARIWRSMQEARPAFVLRLICVLQRGGIDSPALLASYLDWATGLGIREVCFKELYVSSSVESVYHRHAANAWSLSHQVPLSLVLEFAAMHRLEEGGRLPWGSPIFVGQWRGKPIRIVAYTEPSLFWERSTGIARSWNLMADGRCFASLEDRASEVVIA